MVKAQEYINKQYPNKEERTKATELNLSNQNLEGELDLSDFVNLEELNCPNNQLTELNVANCPSLEMLVCYDNLLVELDLNNNSKLEMLNIGNNNFSEQDLSFLSDLINLEAVVLGNGNWEKIQKGIYNRFTGSLKNLNSLVKLECLDIRNTDISEGLEHLSESLEEFICSVKERPEAKVQNIYKLFADEKGIAEIDDYSVISNFREKIKRVKTRENWQSIHQDFTLELRKKWERKGLDYDRTKEWIDIGLEPNDIELVHWLIQQDHTAEWCLNNSDNIMNLKKEHEEWKNTHKDFCEGIWVKRWKNLGFNHLETKQWLEAGFSILDYKYVAEWKSYGFDLEQTKSWIAVGLSKIYSANLAAQLKQSNFTPQDWNNFFTNVSSNNFQRWLDYFYPLEKRNDIEELDISSFTLNKRLEGFLNLEGFTNLKKFFCSAHRDLTQLNIINSSKLTEIVCRDNYNLNALILSNYIIPLGKIDFHSNKLGDLGFLNNLDKEKLTDLNIRDNNFPQQDLEIFRRFTNLQNLEISNKENRVSREIYNRFFGSLESLQSLIKLKELGIQNTDIDNGLEFLPESLEKIYCSSNLGNKDWKVKEIQQQLEIYVENKNNTGYYDFLKWRKKKENKETILQRQKDDLKKLVDSAKSMLGEDSEFLVEELLKVQINVITDSIDSSAKESLEILRTSLSKKIGEKKVREICQKQKKIIQVQEAKNSLINFFNDDIDYDWTIIHPNFTDELVYQWQSDNFTVEQCKEWIDIGLKTSDTNFATWLRDTKHLTPEQVLNHYNLEQLNQEFFTYWQEEQQSQIEQPPK